METVVDKLTAMLPLTWLDAAALLLLVAVWTGFSWSIRQFGFCSILVGATRKPRKDAAEYPTDIDRIAVMLSFAHRNFNQGLRGYYFGVATLSWFLHPALMIAVTLGVPYVLHQREFRSRTLQVLLHR